MYLVFDIRKLENCNQMEKKVSVGIFGSRFSFAKRAYREQFLPTYPQIIILSQTNFCHCLCFNANCFLGRWAYGPLGRWAVGPLGRWAVGSLG